MALVKMHNKERNITYVYESESYWDKTLKQPRSRRRLVGKIDPETGEVVPTGPRGKRRAAADVAEGASDGDGRLREELDATRAELERTRAELEACREALSRIAEIASRPGAVSP